MKAKKALSIWAAGSAVWIVLVANSVSRHYALWLEESAFIYNPMMSPHKLLELTPENQEKLLRFHPGRGNRINSFGELDVVKIEFVMFSFKGAMTHTWMPYNGSLSAVDITSTEWMHFKRSLIDQALEQRNKLKQTTLQHHLPTDLAAILGVPVLFLVVILAYILNWRLMDQPTGNRFPDI